MKLRENHISGGTLSSESLNEAEMEIIRLHGTHQLSIERFLSTFENRYWLCYPHNEKFLHGCGLYRLEIIPLLVNTSSHNSVQHLIRRIIRVERTVERGILFGVGRNYNWETRRKNTMSTKLRYANIAHEYDLED